MRLGRKLIALVAAALLAVAGLAVAGSAVAAPASAGLVSGATDALVSGTIDPLLQDAIDASEPGDELVAVAVSDGAVTGTLLAALDLVGLDTVAYDRLPMVAVRGTAAELLAAGDVSGVESMWLNTPLEVALAESTAMIGADTVVDDPALGFDGSGVGVAILDSGIDGLHPDLEYPAKTIQNVKILGNQHVFEDLTFTVEGVANTDTTAGHGTHVAGIAAGTGAASDGTYRGVAPGADLIGLGSAEGVEMITALAGYDWILANHDAYGIRVINNSWADGSIAYDPAHPLNVASKAAHDEGIVVVFAAGNDGTATNDDGSHKYNRYAFPDWVIGVGGVTKLGAIGDATGRYSSRGDAEHHPDVVAPGSYIASARAITGVVTDVNSSPFDFTDPLSPRMIAAEHTPYYTAATGTSMAAPHVTGVVALVLDANPSLTPDEVKAILADTATPVAGCAVIDCGAGMVNAVAAVQAALSAPANQAPDAALTASGASGEAPLTVTFDASTSTDPDGTIVEFEWDLDGDGVFELAGTEATRTATYPSGSYRISVRVTDDDGASSSPASVEVRSSDAPTAAATSPRQAWSEDVVTIDASASTDPDGTIVEYRFTFGDGSDPVVTTSPTVDHVWTTEHTSRFTWTVTVVDDAGVADATSGTIRVTPRPPSK